MGPLNSVVTGQKEFFSPTIFKNQVDLAQIKCLLSSKGLQEAT